jgi:hypothetical protein
MPTPDRAPALRRESRGAGESTGRRARETRRTFLAARLLLLLIFLPVGTLLAQVAAPPPPMPQGAETALSDTQATRALPAPRIGLVTMGPGPEYWARFGHNAILVDDGRTRTLYNYGYFDFAQANFLTRFLQGRMLYQLVALPMDADLRGYAADGRGVVLQWLRIEPGRAQALADFLAWNARPENAEYRYDYFTENCSTKVRDALDQALGGELRRALSGRSHGYTFRDEARRLAATLPWLYLGIHLGLGPFTDKPTSLWEESYVPQRLREAVAEVRNADGEPLVAETIELLPHRIADAPASPPDWRAGFLATGIALSLLFVVGVRPGARSGLRRVTTLALGLVWGACGFIGLGLLALWGFTDHVAAWGNENVLLFNPLCLALLPALAPLWRGARPARWLGRVALAVALCAGLALFLKFLPFRIQSNGDWIALMLPIHTLLAWRLRA